MEVGPQGVSPLKPVKTQRDQRRDQRAPEQGLGRRKRPHQAAPMSLSKVQSVDQQMRIGMRCRLSPTADVPSHTSGAAIDALIEESKNSRCSRSGRSVRSGDDPGCAGASEVSEGEMPCRTRRSRG